MKETMQRGVDAARQALGNVKARLAVRSGQQVLTILAMTAVVVVPAAITLSTVRVTPVRPDPALDPTPLGYTWSLLLFLVPILGTLAWHLMKLGWRLRGVGRSFDLEAFMWSATIMALLGAFLDIAFGYHFFVFPNPAATVELRIPAWDWGDLRWVPDYLPVEEFAFYILGSIYMVAVYLWADVNWLEGYDPDSRPRAEENRRLVEPSPGAVALWIVLAGLGVALKLLFSDSGWFPGYWVFLLSLALMPALLIYPTVTVHVNWRAFRFAFGSLLFISLLWEATLGVPYGWWGYKPELMIGIFVRAWSDLPVEAVAVWLVGAWTAIMLYEFFRILLHRSGTEATYREIMFGARSGPDRTEAPR